MFFNCPNIGLSFGKVYMQICPNIRRCKVMAFAKLMKKNSAGINLEKLHKLKSDVRTEVYRASFRR